MAQEPWEALDARANYLQAQAELWDQLTANLAKMRFCPECASLLVVSESTRFLRCPKDCVEIMHTWQSGQRVVMEIVRLGADQLPPMRATDLNELEPFEEVARHHAR